MRVTAREAVISTIAYSSIFHYRLTSYEVIYWLIGASGEKFSFKEVNQYKKEYTQTFPKDASIIHRREKERLAKEKWTIAQKVAAQLKHIPSIMLIGVTGGLAMNNVDNDDDIDFLVITASKTLWISRLLLIFILEFLGKRRRPNMQNVKNRICLNMFMTQDHLVIPKKEQDLFSAHEVLQMEPLWDRDNVYWQFLQKNYWIKEFLPNAWQEKVRSDKRKVTRKNYIALSIGIWILRFFELPSKYLQLGYMKKHRTTEVVSDTMLRFHPRDARRWIKQELGIRLAPFNIPLDKIFYAR